MARERNDVERTPHSEKAMAFQFLSSPLLHDLNRMNVMLNIWDEDLHPVPKQVLREMIHKMEGFIAQHEQGVR